MKGQGDGFGAVVFAINFNQRACRAIGFTQGILLRIPVIEHAPNLTDVFIATLGARDGDSVNVEHPQIHQTHGLPIERLRLKTDN